MISPAREVYSSPRTDPGRLVDLEDRGGADEVTGHLLDGFLAGAYGTGGGWH